MQPLSYLKLLLTITILGGIVSGLVGIITGISMLGYIVPLAGATGCGFLIWKIIVKPAIEEAKRKNIGMEIKRADKKVSILILLCLGFAVVCLIVGFMADNSTISVLGIVGFIGASFVGMGYANVLQFKKWKLNRKPNKLPLSYRIKQMKPEVRNQAGKKLSITGRGEVLFLSFVTWLFLEGLCVYLKINSVTSFEVACVGGFGVMGALVGLYFSRRKRRMIVKFTLEPILGKYYFISCSVIITVVLSLTPLSWEVGVPLGLLISGVVYLRAVRGRGFTKSGGRGKFKFKKHDWSRFKNNFRRSRKFSF